MLMHSLISLPIFLNLKVMEHCSIKLLYAIKEKKEGRFLRGEEAWREPSRHLNTLKRLRTCARPLKVLQVSSPTECEVRKTWTKIISKQQGIDKTCCTLFIEVNSSLLNLNHSFYQLRNLGSTRSLKRSMDSGFISRAQHSRAWIQKE